MSYVLGISAELSGADEVNAGFRSMGEGAANVGQRTISMNRELMMLGVGTAAVGRLGEAFGLLTKEQANVITTFGSMISLTGSIVRAYNLIAGSSWAVTLAEHARAIAHAIANTMASWGTAAPILIAAAAAVAAGVAGYFVGHMAEGGIVARPTIALIGERGPEAVIPLSKINTSSTSVTIYITESQNGRSTSDQVIDALRRRGVI